MKKIIIIISICLIVIVAGVLTGLYIIGDKIIDETFDMSIPTTISQEAATVTNETEKDAEISQGGQSAQTNQVADTSATTGTVTDTADTDTEKKTALPTDKPAISVEKMNEIKDQVTATEKVSVATKVMSKLSSSDISQLKSMAAGGLTAEEKEKAKSIAFANFSSEEIQEIKEMYRKYMNK